MVSAIKPDPVVLKWMAHKRLSVLASIALASRFCLQVGPHSALGVIRCGVATRAEDYKIQSNTRRVSVALCMQNALTICRNSSNKPTCRTIESGRETTLYSSLKLAVYTIGATVDATILCGGSSGLMSGFLCPTSLNHHVGTNIICVLGSIRRQEEYRRSAASSTHRKVCSVGDPHWSITSLSYRAFLSLSPPSHWSRRHNGYGMVQ